MLATAPLSNNNGARPYTHAYTRNAGGLIATMTIMPTRTLTRGTVITVMMIELVMTMTTV